MATRNQRLSLQIVIGLIAMIPIFVGLNGIFQGPNVLLKTNDYSIQVDSHLRYLSGLRVAMGIFLLRNLPTIDRNGDDLCRVSLFVFIGGLGRLWGLITIGFDFDAIIAALIELFILPIICLWQNQIERKTTRLRQ
ncbi:unnamed protein product [Rotaria sp. Silwood2]|nr:unnamed protein product [Rotaria sp. Silwood2]CAF3057690.1 unnamed protein product [Rotaria sp. Silwood2]CAF4191394.1 unnamed protein product [Rotaria sp. Silwood2]CAF4351412.1 unnamed protein product [Rotaria sp. Silwood2]